MRNLTLILLVGVSLLGGCRKTAAGPEAPHPRIVSLSPALTQMMLDMGLGAHLVAVTGQDELPAGMHLPVVGDAFSVNAEAVQNVDPDVVMIQMNPDRLESVRRLCPKARIELFHIERLDDLAAAMERVATLAGQPQVGQAAAAKFRGELEAIHAKVANLGRPRVLFITDFDTLGTAGKGTFIDDMIDVAGGVNVADKYSGWVMTTAEGIVNAAPDIVICQAKAGQEPRAMAFWKSLSDLPATKAGRIFVVNDRRWTIPTQVMVDFTADLARKVHPESGGGS